MGKTRAKAGLVTYTRRNGKLSVSVDLDAMVRDATQTAELSAERRAVMDADVAASMLRFLEHEKREHFVTLILDVRNNVLSMETVAIGTLSASLVHPREVFKSPIVQSAAALILAHNHPSGDPEPSADDLALTRRMKQVGELIGIEVLDHIIVGGDGRFVSLKQRGLM